MLLNDFLNSKEHKRRILIVADMGRGLSLLRKHEAITGELVHNVTCMTLEQMLMTVYLYIRSDAGYVLKDEIIDQTEGMMLFRSVIFKNINSLKYFKNEKMMDLVTTREIFDKASLVRANGWTGEESKPPNSRIDDLKLLISEYEQKLIDDELMDNISLLKYVISEMKKWPNPELELNNIFAADIFYLAEDMDCISGIQRKLLSLLQNGQNNPVEVYSENPTISDLENCKSSAEFFRGYGSYNEASYVANDILAKNIPFGSVSVLYTSKNQLPAITAALQGNGLHANIVSDYPAFNNAYINLARRILSWARDNFSEKALERILASPVICVETDDGAGTKTNVLAKQSYFNYVSDAADRRENNMILGWGYDRNLEFIAHENKLAVTDEVKAVINLHSALIDIFGEAGKPYDDKNKVQPIVIYRKLVSFMEKYTLSNEDYAVGMDGIRRLSGAIGLEDRSLSLDEVLSFADNLLASISVKDAADANAVSLQRISGWILLDRPYVYVTGLSLKDMQGSTTESPVLSDEELLHFLGEGYKPTIKAKTQQKEINLYRTLKSFSGKQIVFGFSSYDTIEFYENNPSSFFREALQAFKGSPVKSLPEFVYGNPTNKVEIPLPAGMPDKSAYDVRLSTSNSTLETLLDCPKKYFYSKKLHIPADNYVESDYSKWLDARLKGSFFHEIAEKYVTKMLVKNGMESYDTAADDKLIRKIAEDIENKMLVEMPAAFKALADRETEQLIKAAVTYLNILHNDLNTTGWRVLLAEQKFVNAAYKVSAYDGRAYDFILAGTIDRIDYKVEAASKKILLRIIDYKTGKKESKKKENNLGKLIQYSVYKKALMETGHYEDEHGTDEMLLDVVKSKISELEAISDINSWNVEFESFNYVFPMENLDHEPIVILGGDIEGINLSRLKCILTAIQDKKTYPDHIELYNAVKEYAVKYASVDKELVNLNDCLNYTRAGAVDMVKDEASHCSFCDYQSLCIHRKAGDL